MANDSAPDAHREWELDGRTHRTAADAYEVIARAKLGAHVAATDTYLEALAVLLRDWAAQVDAVRAARAGAP